MYANFIDEDITKEEEEELIEKAAQKIRERGLEEVSILILESVKPIVYLSGEMSRIFLTPFLPILGNDFNILGENLITVFEDRKNIEKLIQNLENKMNDKELEKKIKQKQKHENNSEDTEKKGLLRWWPF